MMRVFAIVGYLMCMLDYPLVPSVFGIVLALLAEPALHQPLIISDGSFAIFFTRTYTDLTMVAALLLLFLSLFRLIYDKIRNKKSQDWCRK